MEDRTGAILASAGYDHTIRFWNIANGCFVRTLQHTESQVNALAISPDRHLIAAAGYQHIRIYDAQQGSTNAQPIVNYEGFSKNVTSIGFNKDMRWMYTGSEDFSARIWDLRTRTLDCQRIYQVNTPVNSVCLHPNQAELFIGDQSGTVHLWDMRNDHNEQIIPEPGYSINHVDVDQDGTMLAAVNSNGVCFLWNMVSSALPDESTRLNPKIKVQKELHNRYALKCRFSPDATLLATTSADQTCRVWRTADFSECATLKVPGQRWVWDCAFTADSQYIFTCSSDNAVRLWKAEDGGPPIRSQAPLPGIGKSSIPVVNALSGYGKMNTNVENGKISSTVEWASKPIREYLGHQRSVTCIALADTPIY